MFAQYLSSYTVGLLAALLSAVLLSRDARNLVSALCIARAPCMQSHDLKMPLT